MIPQTYPSTYESYNDRTSMVVYELTSVIGLQEWIDYIPVKNTLPSESEVNTYANNGAIQIDSLSSSTGLQAWLNYIPVYQKSTGTAWVDYIPVYRSSTFTAVLTNSLLLRNGTGSPTYTRATTATQEDNEQKLNRALSGEVRFQGARRVLNYVIDPENLNGSQWTKQAGAVVTQISGAEWEVDISACANGLGVYFQSLSVGPFIMRGSVSLRAISTSGDNTLTIAEPFGTLFASFNTPALTSNWVRIATPVFSIASVGGMWFQKQPGRATVFRIKEPQLENVTGQSIQTPGEYVSVGVLSSPFHGAMVDGVKYFATTNGNTVASNVVTEATGSPISSATLKGYLAEGTRTNLCLQSENLGTSWSNIRTSESLNTATAPDGTLTADTLVEDATATTTHYIFQAFTGTAAAYTLSGFAKAGTRSWIKVDAYDGTTSAGAYFNLGAGVIGTTDAGITATITSYPNGWYRYAITRTMAASAACEMDIYLATGNGGFIYSGDGSSGAFLWGAQVELGAFASSYIPTTTAAVVRNADVLTYPFAGNGSATQGTIYAEYFCANGAVNSRIITISDNTTNNRTIESYILSSTQQRIFGNNGAVQQYNIFAYGFSTSAVNKFAAYYGANAANLCVNGTLGTEDTSVSLPASPTTITVGTLAGASTSNLFGTIRNVRIYSIQLSASQLQVLTS